MIEFIWFCASGYSFFLGAGIITISVLLSLLIKKSAYRFILSITVILGMFLVFLSATPFWISCYLFWLFFIIGWMVLNFKKKAPKDWHRIFGAATVVISCFLILHEYAYFIHPAVNIRGAMPPVYVIGDSISAGISGQGEKTWHVILREKYNIDIINLAESGATASSAYKQAEKNETTSSLVIVEIGGNDILGGTSAKQFGRDMNKLLKKLQEKECVVIMFELPVLPWQMGFIRKQRALANKYHNVSLIPRRYMVSVLSSENSTTDGIHLTAQGQEKMAEMIRPFIGHIKEEMIGED